MLLGERRNRNILGRQWCPQHSSRVQLKCDDTRWRMAGKLKGKHRIEWVASTLHTTSEHGVSSIIARSEPDGTGWRTGGVVKGIHASWVGSQYPSHYLGTWCIQHYYRWCAHLGWPVVDWTDAPCRFKWTRPFRPKDEIRFVCVCHHISNDLWYE